MEIHTEHHHDEHTFLGRLERIERVLSNLDKRVEAFPCELSRMEKRIMASLQDVKDSIAGLGNDIATEIQAVSDKIGTLQNNGGASPDELADLKSQLDALRTTVQTETASLSGQGSSNPPA